MGQCVLGFESQTKINEPFGSGHFPCMAGLRYRGLRMASHTLTSSSNNAFSLWRTLQMVRKLHVLSLGINYQLRYIKASIHWRKGSNGNLSARTFPVQSELQHGVEKIPVVWSVCSNSKNRFYSSVLHQFRDLHLSHKICWCHTLYNVDSAAS